MDKLFKPNHCLAGIDRGEAQSINIDTLLKTKKRLEDKFGKPEDQVRKVRVNPEIYERLISNVKKSDKPLFLGIDICKDSLVDKSLMACYNYKDELINIVNIGEEMEDGKKYDLNEVMPEKDEKLERPPEPKKEVKEEELKESINS